MGRLCGQWLAGNFPAQLGFFLSFHSVLPRSHQVLITGFRGEQMTWDLDSKTQLATVPLAGCLHSRTGRYLVDYNGDDENLYFLNPDGTTTRVLATGQNVLEAVAFTPDEELVATGGMHNTVKSLGDGQRPVGQYLYGRGTGV